VRGFCHLAYTSACKPTGRYEKRTDGFGSDKTTSFTRPVFLKRALCAARYGARNGRATTTTATDPAAKQAPQEAI
jgi:hypothetical protein